MFVYLHCCQVCVIKCIAVNSVNFIPKQVTKVKNKTKQTKKHFFSSIRYNSNVQNICMQVCVWVVGWGVCVCVCLSVCLSSCHLGCQSFFVFDQTKQITLIKW